MNDEQPLTYASVGVDLEKRRGIVERYKDVTRRATRPEVLSGVGPFGGLFQLGNKYRDPVLVSSTDGVGTKLKLATLVGRYEGLGHDVVNQSVNDALCCGAEPLFFLDYMSCGVMDPEDKIAVVKGVADACATIGAALIGGETADMPDVYPPGEFDLAGFVVSVVERDAIIDGSKIAAGDVIFGLPSNGPHTNGYTLVRAALGIGVYRSTPEDDKRRLLRHEEELGESLADALLKPHLPYVNELKPALALINGLSHITGGAFEENMPRVLPEGLGARIRKDSWPVPPIFPFIQKAGGIDDEEMYRVFNMGIGMAIIVSPDKATKLRSLVPGAIEIGEVTTRRDGEPQVDLG
ncbi:MAG: phosphoribosylformylglycinamidine cyclo-ligase [Dehalococcoidia bacterium]